ncbi:S1 family peptidase [Roseivivax isoporae]|uniref:Serine protease n=1 Tax=Roseivivax isoporae LMG 25204 TaxID=1449351 RepID=X7FB00_9RHOB|nr:serine protease [Roseivivax isoporae]ETX29291.1 hypothetical protein RISW2_02030 [Roseivivax isoporae LMG 25204]
MAEHADDPGLAALIARLRAFAEDASDAETGRGLLEDLKDHRQFEQMLGVAETLLMQAPDDVHLRKLRAQALLDTGRPSLARDALRALVADGDPAEPEIVDAMGLLGRAYKDLMLGLADTHPDRAATCARASLAAYLDTFRAAPAGRSYHGINAAAVRHWAGARGLDHGCAETPADIAAEVHAALEAEATDPPTIWWIATRTEAFVAQGRVEAAFPLLARYIGDPRATLFTLGSTLRQFAGLWALHECGPEGKALIALLESSYLQRSQAQGVGVGASLVVAPDHLRDMRTGEIEARGELEAILGAEQTKSLDWYRDGLRRAAAVGLVTRRGGGRKGTCFCVDPADFGLPAAGGALYALTNFHVLNRAGVAPGIVPADARIRFEAADEPVASTDYAVAGIVAESDAVGGLDYALLRLEAAGGGPQPLELRPDLPRPDPAARAYVVGYPQSGTGLSFSLHDSRLLDHEGPADGVPERQDRIRIHYFSPTEPGNSGSPVFDREWRCIGLHRAGYRIDMRAGLFGTRKLNGRPGTYAANEGYWIRSVIEDVRRQTGG